MMDNQGSGTRPQYRQQLVPVIPPQGNQQVVPITPPQGNQQVYFPSYPMYLPQQQIMPFHLQYPYAFYPHLWGPTQVNPQQWAYNPLMFSTPPSHLPPSSAIPQQPNQLSQLVADPSHSQLSQGLSLPQHSSSEQPPAEQFQFLTDPRSTSILAEALQSKIIGSHDLEEQLLTLDMIIEILEDSLKKRSNPQELDTVALAFKPLMSSMLSAAYLNLNIQGECKRRLHAMLGRLRSEMMDNQGSGTRPQYPQGNQQVVPVTPQQPNHECGQTSEQPPAEGFQFLTPRSISILAEAFQSKIIRSHDLEEQLLTLDVAIEILEDSVTKRHNPQELDTVALAFKPLMSSMFSAACLNLSIEGEGKRRLHAMLGRLRSVFDVETVKELQAALTRSERQFFPKPKTALNLQPNLQISSPVVTLEAMASVGGKKRLSGVQKLAIFCYSIKEYDDIYELYVVEADFGKIISEDSSSSSNSSNYIDINPKIRFVSPQIWGGCVFGSFLYVFQGNTAHFFSDFDYPDHKLHKSVKRYDLSLLDLGSDAMIGIEQFEDVAPMNCPKQDPVAVVTPDGKKILVLANTVSTDPSYPCAFELYDPLENTWEVLEPPDFGRGVETVYINAYTFVNQYTLLLQTVDNGVFFLDITTKLRIGGPAGPARTEPWRRWPRSTIGGRFVVLPGAVIELPSLHEFTPSHLPDPDTTFSPGHGEYEPPPSVALLDCDEKACYTLFSQTQICAPYHPRLFLLIDVCRTDLDDASATTVVGNLKYTINRGYMLFTLGMFLF